MRLKTLPLAAGGIVLGSFLAAYEYSFSLKVFALLLSTAVLLQILSNLANDYGDFKKGTDSIAGRNDRALVSGKISEKAMLRALYITSILSLFCGIWLLILVFGFLNFQFYLWLTLGIISIIAALKYTGGKNPYGYSGWGDLAVFVFFGIIAVFGSYFFMTTRLTPNIIVPSISWGLLCVAVLNINNLRDFENDKNSGKITLAVLLGLKNTRFYLYIITLISIILMILFSRLTETKLDAYMPIAFSIPYYFIYRKITIDFAPSESFNKALRNVSLLSFAFVLVLGIIWLWQ